MTILRDVAIIDAVNNIVSKGNVPHPCVGDACRVMANP